MIQLLVVFVVGLLVVAGAALIGPRLGVASPLVLVVVGVAASLVPMVGGVQIRPEWILEGVLPPLLYSSAVSMPAMNFRREFGAISGLSVVLVVGSALLLGVFFMVVVPGLGFAWGVALGAIVSPTDAVATSIIKRTTVSQRVVAMLDGESLLNDATALVLLRTAIVATAASFSFWGTVGTFAYSVVVAVVIGAVVGWLNLVVRGRVRDPTVNTVISFTVPFAAAIPTELLGASGLVAAVVAGLVTGVRAPRVLSAQHRLSDSQNWRTVEMVLEGAVFLTMGVQITSIVQGAQHDNARVIPAILVAAGAFLLTVIVRAGYVAPLLGVLAARSRRSVKLQPRLESMRERVGTDQGRREALDELSRGRRSASMRDLDRFAVRVTRVLADIEYFVREPLGWRDGTVVVWAGMRGAVTVAAAQTLPQHTPQRSVLVLIAFTVAVLSLLVQGGTIGPLVRLLAPQSGRAAPDERARVELERIFALMKTAAEAVPQVPGSDVRSPEGREAARRYRLAVLDAQRAALLDARDNGTFDADVLADALATIDAAQIEIETQGRLTG